MYDVHGNLSDYGANRRFTCSNHPESTQFATVSCEPSITSVFSPLAYSLLS